MAVASTLIKKAIGGYAEKPVVPDYVPVDAGAEQINTIQQNFAALNESKGLIGQTNQFNIEQLQKMLEQAMPGYGGMVKDASSLIQSQLRGEIPKDVQDAIQNSSAASAIGGGYGGSGMHGKRVARDFGRTSYDITQQGIDSASRWMQMTTAMFQPSMMNAQSMFLTPGQQLDVAFRNTENAFQRDWMANQIKAMPDPAKAALGDAFIEEEAQIMELAGSVAGMAMMCWVAREVLGTKDNQWKLFRHWLLNIGPKWFCNLYRKYGERFAKWISDKPIIKSILRPWFKKKAEVAYGSIFNA